MVWFASALTSAATTAKPLPASPARAASIVAFRARRLVCEAIARDQRDDVADALRRDGEALDDLVGVLHVHDGGRRRARQLVIWRVISRIEAASSSVAPATVCTLSEVWSAKAETSSAWRFVSSAVSASERAVVSISSEEAESASACPVLEN